MATNVKPDAVTDGPARKKKVKGSGSKSQNRRLKGQAHYYTLKDRKDRNVEHSSHGVFASVDALKKGRRSAVTDINDYRRDHNQSLMVAEVVKAARSAWTAA